jgi:hypothetical protein
MTVRIILQRIQQKIFNCPYLHPEWFLSKDLPFFPGGE